MSTIHDRVRKAKNTARALVYYSSLTALIGGIIGCVGQFHSDNPGGVVFWFIVVLVGAVFMTMSMATDRERWEEEQRRG